ncbi:MAG: putative ABC transporter permease [Lachnospiraceae bacterium]|nr:putative ABC transporter permease [Lachnospiraceae bacterium]
MYSYTLIQWLFLFYFYCFFGWCFESAYVSLKSRKPVNRGFMKGPFLPLYGSGAIMMLVVSKPFLEHWWAVYIAGCIGATVLEYVTGVVMEALFKVRYWDYSSQPFNFQGQICLSSTLAWGGLTLLMNYVIHRPIESLVIGIPADLLTVVTILLTIYIDCDFTLSFKEALDLRDILVRMEKVKEEMDEIKADFESRFNAVKEHLLKKPELQNFYRRIRNNPSMSSKRYKDVLEELKRKAAEKRKK